MTQLSAPRKLGLLVLHSHEYSAPGDGLLLILFPPLRAAFHSSMGQCPAWN